MFRCILSGASASGKSYTLIHDILSHPSIFQKFKIYLICPSYKYQKENGTYKDLHLKNIYETADNETFDNIMKLIDNDQSYNHLIILDDFLGSQLSEKGSSLYTMIPLIRHHKTSIILLTQYLISVPKLIRMNADIIIIFMADNNKQKRQIADELGQMALDFYINNVENSKPYSYMVMDTSKNIQSKERFRTKF